MTVLSTLACVVTSTGISRPSYADIFETLQAKFQGIYGSDAYINPDSQDGQLLAVFAKAIDDTNAMSVMTYNAYSPQTAQGAALSNNVKINGLARGVPTASSVLLRIVGTVGTVITRGIAGDAQGRRWSLPLSVTIPSSGEIIVTGLAEFRGAIEAEVGTITQILTPTLGWQSVENTTAAAPGADIETDAALRQRQVLSVALPSQTVLAGILAAVQTLPGVVQAVIYENDSDFYNSLGLPPHSITLVVDGGDLTQIATAILNKKTPGAYTHGSTAVALTDDYGISYTIRFFVPIPVGLKMAVTVKALVGYTSGIGEAIKQSLADYINALAIGKKVDVGKLYLPAQFFGGSGSETFELDILQIAKLADALGTADIPIAFNEVAALSPADVALTVTT